MLSSEQEQFVQSFLHKLHDKYKPYRSLEKIELCWQDFKQANLSSSVSTKKIVKKPRLTTKDTPTDSASKSTKKAATTTASKRQTIKSEILKQPSLLQKIIAQRLKFVAVKNVWGHYVHAETNFIVDPGLKIIKGTQQDDGKIAPLTFEQVQLCKELRLQFEEPMDFGVPDDPVKNHRDLETDEPEEGSDDDFSEDEQQE